MVSTLLHHSRALVYILRGVTSNSKGAEGKGSVCLGAMQLDDIEPDILYSSGHLCNSRDKGQGIAPTAVGGIRIRVRSSSV